MQSQNCWQLKFLIGNCNIFDWSDDDKMSCSEVGMKLGAPLELTTNLYYDLQRSYG